MRVLLDTNVLVAAFATRGLCQDVFRVVLAEHRLVVGKTILSELECVLRDKLRMPNRQINEAITFVSEHAEVISPAAPATWPENDPDDRWVVSAAIEGSADLVVSGDKDLVSAASAERLQVITPRAFWNLLHHEA